MGLGASVSILATLGVRIVNVVFTVVALVIIDWVGRRPLLLIGLIGIIISLAVLGLAYLVPSLEGVVSWITFACLILYIMSFAASFGVVLWVVLPEIFPLKVRGSGMGVATILHWSSNLLVSLTFLPLMNALGETAVFWDYGLISIGAFAFVYFLMPETKGVAGFLAGQLRGWSTEDCLRLANACGACATIGSDDAESMPSEEEALALVRGSSEEER